MPLEGILAKFTGWLKPGGVLLVLDLFETEAQRLPDLLRSVVALPVSTALRLLKTDRLRPPPAVRRGTHTRLPTAICGCLMCGCYARTCCQGRRCASICSGATRWYGESCSNRTFARLRHYDRSFVYFDVG